MGKSFSRTLALCFAALSAADCGGGGGDSQAAPPPPPPAPEPQMLALTGMTVDVHDPAIVASGGAFYVFSTGGGLQLHRSTNLTDWNYVGDVLGGVPAWAQAAIPGITDVWAPDISFFDGSYHLYYAASTFGSGRSAIGMATNPTLDPADPGYAWTDQGMVIESQPADDFNAIDPNIVFDELGVPWLVFGSWDDTGIRMRRLDADTGLPSALDTTLYRLADRPASGHQIEAPYIFVHGGFYFLFVSFDRCCQGVGSTYNVRVGRSASLTGPYLDMAGTPMTDGGGTLVISGTPSWKGPGHNSIVESAGQTYLVYHAYSVANGGSPYLRISPLQWDSAGWPFIPTS